MPLNKETKPKPHFEEESPHGIRVKVIYCDRKVIVFQLHH